MSCIIKGKPEFIYEVRSYRFVCFYDDMKQAATFAIYHAHTFGQALFTTYKYVNNRYELKLSIEMNRRSEWI